MRTKRKIINLYKDDNTLSIKHVISITTEEDLNQFWEYLTSSNNSSHILINTFINLFYNFALSYLMNKKSDFFEIILEESDSSFYFTLWNMRIAKLFKKEMRRTSLSFLYDDNKISVRLNKRKLQKNIDKIHHKNEKREKKLISDLTKSAEKNILEPYSFISNEDLQELMKLNDDMQELLYQVVKLGLSEDMFIRLRSILSLFCLTLRYYKKISSLATTITHFSNLMNTNRNKFINLNEAELLLIQGFINNIDTWLQTIFIKGGADLYFMDNSIKADYDMIVNIIFPSDDNFYKIEMDDIFNF